ncbi:acyl-CoA thioesterase [Microbispora hainanensis]|uniref:Acyl-CoA thioesterase n=1 Tax=Microbispora hainanensis TaxID=568844 RepID=A0ABZ1SQ78_9ACTN|nr:MULTISPECIES: thioesterase family protein [Microbispora]NJP27721.1 acyl-CoA thioesterase [Microbispora sp. CL1-1]TQS10726.1 acyl-CoA thioesterase [Microbispora sp. SCL1-1]
MTELRNPPEQSTRFVFERKVRFADIDSFGHVNNVRFLDYLEDARVSMLWERPREAGGRRQDLVVARHEIDYRRPLTFRTDPVRVEMWVTEISRVRFTLAYEIRDDETLYAEARTVLVAYDAAEARPRRLDDDELAYLRRFLADAP